MGAEVPVQGGQHALRVLEELHGFGGASPFLFRESGQPSRPAGVAPVDAADGADGEEAADETVELTVSEWVITGPEGVTEFDTSASEEDENVPKQGFYEFAPVLADLPEGYVWKIAVNTGDPLQQTFEEGEMPAAGKQLLLGERSVIVFVGENLDLCVRTGGGKTSENRGANVSRTYSARRYGWHRLRSMRQEKLRNQGTR